jgi:intergrase/recombinase
MQVEKHFSEHTSHHPVINNFFTLRLHKVNNLLMNLYQKNCKKSLITGNKAVVNQYTLNYIAQHKPVCHGQYQEKKIH